MKILTTSHPGTDLSGPFVAVSPLDHHGEVGCHSTWSLYLSPEKARELAADLLRAADDADALEGGK